MQPEVDLVTMTEAEWDDLRAAAAGLDLVRGGCYRVRGETIQFYASPENAPPGWQGGFDEGIPEAPRGLAGKVERIEPHDGSGALLRLTVENWGAARAISEADRAGDYGGDHTRFVLDQEAALRGRPEERAWLRAQFERLRAHTAGDLLEGP
jgi:hypothetical protein